MGVCLNGNAESYLNDSKGEPARVRSDDPQLLTVANEGE